MKVYDPFIYGRSETRKLAERAKTDPVVQAIYEHAAEQNAFIDRHRNPDNPNQIKVPGFLRVGFHIHFPERDGWYSRELKRFNPDKLEDLARSARRGGFDIIAVSNKYDDQVFGHAPGFKFDFPEGNIIVLKAQETGHVMPFGYRGRIRQANLDDVVSSTLDQGGLYLLCHPSNRAYHGAGEAIAKQYRETAILETFSPLVNHPFLNLSFADIIAKEWSLRYRIPGVTVLDSRRYLYGGFFVPETFEGADFSSAENAMEAFARLFQLRREELERTGTLRSDYIINTEAHPKSAKSLLAESTGNAVTSFRSKARRSLFKALHIKDRNIGLRNFDYQGRTMGAFDETRQGNHAYLLKGANEAAVFASGANLRQQPQNLVFFRKDGKLYIGTTFTDFNGYDEKDSLEFARKKFNGVQSSFLEEILSDGRFHEFKLGLHPTYPIACITPDGQKYMFVAKEFLSQYKKGHWDARLFFWMLDKFAYKGEEGLRMAALQSTLQNKGLNVVPPLYLEVSSGGSRIVYPYVRLDSLSKDFSQKPESERRNALDQAADQLAYAKSRGVYLTDMHLGNIAEDVGDWFSSHEGIPIIPDVTVPGTSVTTFGESTHNLINPFSLLLSPRITFVLKARRKQHGLIQTVDDFFYFMESYGRNLNHYRKVS